MLKEDAGIVISDETAVSSSAVSTLPGLLLHSVDQYRKPDAFRFKRNGQWISVSSDEFRLRVEELYFGLRALGIKAGDRIALISENRLEWAVADYAVLWCGASTVPIYPTLSAPQVAALIQDCEPALVFVSTLELLKKIPSSPRGSSPRYIVIFDPPVHQPGIIKLETLYELGRQRAYDYPGEFRRAAVTADPGQVATIIYTSGTTGVPKGAMLTHANLIANIFATRERLPLCAEDVSLSFLPLAHIFQRHVDYASVYAGTTIAHSDSVSSFAEDMVSLRPTFAAGVPRVFEKIYNRILSEVARGPSALRAIFEKARQVGTEYVRTGRSSLYHRAADRLVFRKIRERLGGRIRFFIAGGAALEKEIAEFFWAIGLPVYEGYGLTETSPVVALNGPGLCRAGSVGRAVGGQEVRIAGDGEILVRGPNVMKGYYNMESETAEALAGGWFHTGDIGEFDAEGFLHITDRKKDIIVMSSGKKVAPQPIENRLKLIPYFEHVVIVGDGRSFISALIVPNYDALVAYAHATGITFENRFDLIHKPEIHDLALAEIARRTADLSEFEKIRKVAFLDRDFSIDDGELTPTLKVRRRIIEKEFRSKIDSLYGA